MKAAESWRQYNYKVEHYRIEVAFNMSDNMVTGKTTLKLRPLRQNLKEIIIDAHKFNVKSILYNHKKELSFKAGGDSIAIFISENTGLIYKQPFEITISYSVQPEKGMFFYKPDNKAPDTPLQIWTQGEGADNHYWFPCYDYPNQKASFELIARVDKGLTAISNGKLLDKKIEKGLNVFHYSFENISPSYLVSLIVGKYVKYEQFYDGIPLEYYVYPRYTEKDALRSFGNTPEMLAFFSDYTDYQYPYCKYTQTIIHDFMYSGMENISATTLTERTIHDRRAQTDYSSDGLVAHELAHQWYGDLITCRDWSDMWLNEGFATYFTALYFENKLGNDEFLYRMWQKQQAVIKAELQKPRILSGKTTWGVYIKGASVLHMLRNQIGDSLFKDVVRAYTAKYAFKNAETCDLRQIAEDVSGYKLSPFFNQWVFSGGIPELTLSENYDSRKRKLTIEVVQTQDSIKVRPAFQFSCKIGLYLNNDKYVEKTVTISKRDEVFSFNLKQKPKFIVFDAGQVILKKLNLMSLLPELLVQAQKGYYITDRLMALKQLSDDSTLVYDENIADVMLGIAEGNDFYGVRIAALELLIKTAENIKDASYKNRIGTRLIKLLQRENNTKVRRQLCSNIAVFKTKNSKEELYRYFTQDSSYAVQAEALKNIIKIDSLNAIKYIYDALDMDSYEEVVRVAALENLQKIKQADGLELAHKYSEYGNHPALRNAAINYLCKLVKNDNDNAKQLLHSYIKEGKESNRYRFLSRAVYTLSANNDKALRPLLEDIAVKPGNYYLKHSAERVLKKINKEKDK